MSPEGQPPTRKVEPPNNLYTVILAVAFGIAVATVIYVALMCHFRYETLLP